MKRGIAFIICLLCWTAPAFAQYWKVNVDWADPETFTIDAAQGDAGILRVYNYQSGSALTLPAGWGVSAGYGTNWQFSTALTDMSGTVNTALTYSTISMTSSNLNTNGSFFFQILYTNAISKRAFRGQIDLDRNPIGGGASTLVLKGTVNWDVINNIGALPWIAADSNAISTVSSNNTLLDATDSTVLIDTTGGSVDIDLPVAALHSGRIYHIKWIDPANTATVTPNGSDDLEDAPIYTFSNVFDRITIQSDGVGDWWRID